MKFEWESIYTKDINNEWTFRAKVIGGWIVRHNEFTLGENKFEDMPVIPCQSMVFISDPSHEWVIE